MTDPATATALAWIERELEAQRKRLDDLDRLTERILVEQRAHRARMAAAVEAVVRRNGHQVEP